MIGQTLGHYKILDKLGAGGMGEVYRAEDTTLRRQVALKVLPGALSDDADSLARFRREARVLASLDHPNIVSIHSVEESDGIRFLTMQLVEGEPLSKVISGDDLPDERILEIAVALADALSAAHEKGIIHRDLKPANIMVTEEGRVKVLDFGLAKSRQEAQSLLATEAPTELMTEMEPLTRQGLVVGTVPYMSPEQIQGRPVDSRTDIFSLGIVLYEMACGIRPFQGENPATLMSSILRDEPEPVAELRPGIPQILVDTIERCLEKSPEDRFPTARELHARLEGLQSELTAGRAEVARSRSKASRLGIVTRVLVVAALVLAIVAGAIWFSDRGPGEPTEVISQGLQIRTLAVLPMRNLSGDLEQDYLVDGMTEALITDLSRIGELKVSSRSSAMRYKDTDKPLSEIARELNVDAVVEGSVAREGDRVAVTAQLIEAASETNLWAERYEREIASILTLQGEVAQAIAREIQVTLTPQEEALLTSSREVDPEAYEAYLKGMAQFYEMTPAGMKAAQHYFEQALEKDPDFAQAHGGMALVWAGRQQMGLTSVAEATPKAKASAQRALEIDDSVAEAHYALAVIRTWSDWDWDGAEPAFLRAIELKPNWADVRAYYAHYLMITGRTDEAIAEMEQAVGIDPYNALVQVLNGVLLENTGRCEEALAFYRSTLEAAPNNPLAQGGMLRAYYCLQDYEETYKSAVAIWAARGRPEAVAALENGYTEGGFEGAMSALADWRLKETATDIEPCGRASFELAWAGRTEEALDCIELLFEAHHPDMPYFSVFAIHIVPSLRNQPRLQELLRRMNLPV
jgi:TolB-like protein/Tfp pilus assembly protein PilF